MATAIVAVVAVVVAIVAIVAVVDKTWRVDDNCCSCRCFTGAIVAIVLWKLVSRLASTVVLRMWSKLATIGGLQCVNKKM